jgi:hypothetical protein
MTEHEHREDVPSKSPKAIDMDRFWQGIEAANKLRAERPTPDEDDDEDVSAAWWNRVPRGRNSVPAESSGQPTHRRVRW